MYFAHSGNCQGSGAFQPLEDHLLNTARQAADFAEAWGCADIGWIAGLLHDLGKMSDRFQNYLRGIGTSGGDHKGLGVRQTATLGCPLSFVIAGHHGGLPDLPTIKQALRDTDDPATLEMIKDLLATLDQHLPAHYPDYVQTRAEEAELFTRILFSALVDADFLDTENHFNPDLRGIRQDTVSLDGLWERFAGNYEQSFECVEETPLNLTRRNIYERCLEKAQEPQGAFSLTVPTGGGKTLASMGFALSHAKLHDLRRIIIVIPYTSIIEQTADVYRNILGEKAILEHHSALDWSESGDERQGRWELMAENWDAPIIVTTSVQFFESLFANSPSRCRKLHNIARSVVIIDEVQTLPVGLLKPSFSVLSSLVSHYGVTCLLTTATQPTYSRFTDMPIREIMPDPAALAQELRRVRYERPTPALSWAEAASMMAVAGQAMAVVNTRKDAQALFVELPEEGRVHLSTNLCAAHRRQVLAEVRRRLEAGEPCLLATTQLVEAGVDLDFPLVLRAMGPMERIVQAAGRCNREGKQQEGRVIVFVPAEGGMPPGSYRAATDTTAALLTADPDLDLNDPVAHELYFSRLYQAVDLDAKRVENLRQRLDFPAVAEAYKFIPEDTVAVAVPWGECEALLNAIQAAGHVTRNDLRRLQPYFVNLQKHDHERAKKAGLVKEVLRGSGLWRWEGRYDYVHLGLQWEDTTPSCI